MTEHEQPHLAEVYPALVDYVKTALTDLGEHALANVLRELPFLGWCGCTPSCPYLRTGDVEAADNAWIHLDDDDDTPRVWLQLDRDQASFVGMEVHEFELG